MGNIEDFYSQLLDNAHDGIYFVDAERKIIHWNKGAERITGYNPSEVMGLRCSSSHMVHVDEEGNDICGLNCVVGRTIKDGSSYSDDIYLRHKDGHRVPVRINVSPVRDAAGNIVGAIETFRENVFRKMDIQLMEDLKKADLIDPFTGLANRKYIEMKLRHCVEGLNKNNIPFGMIFIAIDDLQDIDDTYDHDIEQEVFRMVARTLEGNVRAYDLVGRWGEDEFAAVISHVTDEQLVALANKLRLMVENAFVNIREELIIKVTVSMGATLALSDDDMEAITDRAMHILHHGKQFARNCVFTDTTLQESGKEQGFR